MREKEKQGTCVPSPGLPYLLDSAWGSSVAMLHCFLAEVQLRWVAGPVSPTSGRDSLTLLFMQLLYTGPVDAIVFYVIAVSLLTKGNETHSS